MPVDLYAKYHVDRKDERRDLFRILREDFGCTSGMYPGCYVHITPSFYLPRMIYVDTDRRAHHFFHSGAASRLVRAEKVYEGEPEIQFYSQDYTKPLPVTGQRVDVLISQYAGFVSDACARYLRSGGLLIANDSHGDAGLANTDPSFELIAVIHRRGEQFHLQNDRLDEYFVRSRRRDLPERSDLREYLKALGRGLRYASSADDYLFRKV